MSTQQTHYQVLQIPPEPDLKAETVKQAYHRALLVHHPDKAYQVNVHAPSEFSATAIEKPTIDQIVRAYAVLSDPSQRKSYDAALKSSSKQNVAHRGIDSYDLDDLEYTEKDGHGIWQRPCRCDSGEGYIVTQQDLERADSEQEPNPDGSKEIIVGCRGCSLFIRVTFAVESD